MDAWCQANTNNSSHTYIIERTIHGASSIENSLKIAVWHDCLLPYTTSHGLRQRYNEFIADG